MGAPADRPLAGSRGADAWVLVALSFQTTISAFTYLAAKRGLAELGPVTLVFWRFALSAVLFMAILLLTPGRLLPPRRALPAILYLGFLVGPVNQLLFFVGLRSSLPAHASLLYALTPLGVYGVSLARGRERLRARASAGILLALVGTLILLLGPGLAAFKGVFVGDLWILAAVAGWVCYTSDGKALIEAHGAVRSTCWTMICGALLMLPLAPRYAQPHRVLASSAVTLGCILYLAILTSVVSYLLWYFALSRTEASRVAVFSNLQPVLTAVAAWAILHDPLRWSLAAGGGLVLAGVALTNRAAFRQVPPASGPA